MIAPTVITYGLLPGTPMVIGSGPVDIRSVMNPVPADLMVDMARFPVRLTTLTGLAEGAVIPIPPMPLGRATLRAIDEGRSALAARAPVDWRRRIIGAGVVAALIGVVWWALVASSAERWWNRKLLQILIKKIP